MSVQQQIDRLTAQRAAEWFEVYRTGREDQFPGFVAWLTESPRNLKEFLAIAGQYPSIRDALRSGDFDLAVLLGKLAPNVLQLRPPALPRTELRPGLGKWAMAAGLAAVALLGAFLFWGRPGPLSAWQHFETQVGEQRIVQLVDGSVLTLNAQSLVAVRMGRSQRDIRLLRGEAMFKVAHDTARPFLVHAQRTTVRAVGTQFNVYARPDGSTTVAVLEGKVEVSAGAEANAASAHPSEAPPTATAHTELLAAGEEASITATGAIKRDAHADTSSAVAWRQRRLIFDRTALEEIVLEFNRYNRTLRIRLANVPPGAFHFTGSFDADDPQSLALLLSREPDLSVEQHKGEILIRGH